MKLLPKPYLTACIDYRNDDFYSQYRTSDECKNICIKDYSLRENSCANYYSVLTSVQMFEKEYREQHICGHENQVGKLWEV